MHGSGRCLCHRSGGETPPQPRRVGHVLGDARVEEPSRRAAVQALLVDRLVGAHALQLWRTVSGEHDHRRPRVGSLDDRGVKLGRCRAGRTEHDSGLAGRLAETDSKERAASLVDMDEDLDARMPLKCHRQGRRARARRDAREFHALRRELIHEGCGEVLGDVSHRIES